MRFRFRPKNVARALVALGFISATALASADTRDVERHRPAAAPWCADRWDAVITDSSLTAYQVIRAADGYRNP